MDNRMRQIIFYYKNNLNVCGSQANGFIIFISFVLARVAAQLWICFKRLCDELFKKKKKPKKKPGIVLWMHPANERPRYNVTSSLIGWAHSQNDPETLI